jgi:hypothetical protein
LRELALCNLEADKQVVAVLKNDKNQLENELAPLTLIVKIHQRLTFSAIRDAAKELVHRHFHYNLSNSALGIFQKTLVLMPQKRLCCGIRVTYGESYPLNFLL